MAKDHKPLLSVACSALLCCGTTRPLAPRALCAELPTVDVSRQQPPNDAVIDSLAFAQSRSTIGRFASTVDGDHEDAGVLTSGGGAYGGVEATHTVFTSKQLKLSFPPDAKDVQTLFAPTTRPPNGSCLEMGTAYSSAPRQATAVSLYVFDFCAGMQFVVKRSINQMFLTDYTKSIDANRRSYRLRIYVKTKTLTSGSNWYAALLNVTTNTWDEIYSHAGVSKDTRGWTIFETWYNKGQCSKFLPMLSASDISYKNLSTGEWEPLARNMSHLVVEDHNGVSSSSTNTNCFHDDYSGKASYLFRVDKPESAWSVIATGN